MNALDKNEYQSERFKGLDFSNREISAIEFDDCQFEQCNFSEATLRRCKFVDCEFLGCNLSNVRLEYSKFSEVCFRDSKLIGIDWTKVAWPKFIFASPIKFYQSILNDSSFNGLVLQELVLEECKAHHVDFRDGNFTSANFTYTDLTASLFAKTNLTSANFSEASNYDINIFNNIIKKATFSRYEAIRLLDSLEIELVD